MTEVHRVRSVRRWFVEAVGFYPRVALLGFRVFTCEKAQVKLRME